MGIQKALLVLNGYLNVDRFVNHIDPSAFTKIAVDGGLQYFRRMLVPPDVLIGDLDSVTPDDLLWAKQHNTLIVQFPAEKDESDFQLALNWVIERQVQQVRIAGGLGGRLDQTLANCFLLLDERLKVLDICFDDGIDEVSLIQDRLVVYGQPGDIVSLLPLLGTVLGVTTHRLKYPLSKENLFMHQARGISNVMLEATAAIEVKQGTLLCIHTRQEE